jgi:hypothetical protein
MKMYENVKHDAAEIAIEREIYIYDIWEIQQNSAIIRLRRYKNCKTCPMLKTVIDPLPCNWFHLGLSVKFDCSPEFTDLNLLNLLLHPDVPAPPTPRMERNLLELCSQSASKKRLRRREADRS